MKDSYDGVNREILQKDQKKLQLQSILDAFKKDNYIGHFEKDIATD